MVVAPFEFSVEPHPARHWWQNPPCATRLRGGPFPDSGGDGWWHVTAPWRQQRYTSTGIAYLHSGVDAVADDHAPTMHEAFRAWEPGVAYLYPDDGDGNQDTTEWGNAVVFHPDSGGTLAVFHLSEFAVGDGQRVEAGDVLGYVGSTGKSTGPHLHIQCFLDRRRHAALTHGWETVDPIVWLQLHAAAPAPEPAPSPIPPGVLEALGHIHGLADNALNPEWTRWALEGIRGQAEFALGALEAQEA